MEKKKPELITLIIFSVLIFGIAIFNILNPDNGFSESENRFLEKMPEFSWNALFDGSYTSDFETYITDQFIARDEFIGIKTQTEYLMGKKDTNDVYFANDNYLIEKKDDRAFNREQLEKNIERVTEFINTAYSQYGNNRVTLMLVPTAIAILSDKLPPYAPKFDQKDLLDNVKSKIPSQTYVNVFDKLKEHDTEEIYYKTDHHWTTKGAYYGYEAYKDKVGILGMSQDDFNITSVTNDFLGTVYSKARLYSTKPDTINKYVPNKDIQYTLDFNNGERIMYSLYDDEYLTKRDKYSYFLGGNNALVKILSSNKNGRKLLLVKDSYAHSMVPFLANDFEEIHMVDLRHFNLSLKDYMQSNNITDSMVLYNIVTFADDLNLFKLNR